ncbi:NucA/NucB deoxyribonuclease domain-containing protein [Plantactinospora sp. CA-294935]|uniref:NucA/NucB deoxyribonuclease domain-containing protein n=1 Tax=Plantactinospora sp. CA-294935 TaxID=3240012 RepID=UPI003D8A4A2C
MTTVLKRLAVLLTTTLATGVAAVPATAAPASAEFGWIVTESVGGTPVPPDAPPQTNSAVPRSADRATASREDELKEVCRSEHASAAATQEGWMADRFSRCHIGHRKVELRCTGCTTVLASVEFDYTLIGIAQNGTRQVDFTLTFDNWTALGGVERETTPMRVDLSGCNSGLVTCTPTSGEREQLLGTWRLDPRFDVTMTSPDGTGIGAEYLVDSLVELNMAIMPVDPRIAPWIEDDMTRAQVRFDSAGQVAGKHNGTVFADFIPTYDLLALARADGNEQAVRESIQHIDDALHHVERTFPSLLIKVPPGEFKPSLGADQRPLHRLVDSVLQDRNRTYAGKVCEDVWGPGAASPNLNCDEYPFASTKEGAYTGSSAADGDTNGWRTWHGSSRLIGELDNQESGRRYLNLGFYQTQRILNNDPFFVSIDR